MRFPICKDCACPGCKDQCTMNGGCDLCVLCAGIAVRIDCPGFVPRVVSEAPVSRVVARSIWDWILNYGWVAILIGLLGGAIQIILYRELILK